MKKGQLIYFVSDEFGVIRMRVSRVECSKNDETGSIYDTFLFTELDMPLMPVCKNKGVFKFYRRNLDKIYIDINNLAMSELHGVFFDEKKALTRAKERMDLLVSNAYAELNEITKNKTTFFAKIKCRYTTAKNARKKLNQLLKNQAALSQPGGW